MVTGTIKSVLSIQALALWPGCWKSVSNDADSSGNKNWEEEIAGSKSLARGDSSCTKAAASSSTSWVNLCASLCLAFLSGMFLPHWYLRKDAGVISGFGQEPLVLAGCNSNSMWKVLISSSGGAVTCRERPNTTQSLQLRALYFDFYMSLLRDSKPHRAQGDDLWIDSQWL